jgi:glucosyl-3-phosphoglycerate synthase
MADFHQSGVISTLHRFAAGDWHALEDELLEYRDARPIALALPCLYTELEGTALPQIVEQLRHARYLARIVVALGRADREQFRHALEFFSPLPNCSVLWIDSPAIQGLIAELEEFGLPIGPDGKGRSCWLAAGFVMAHEELEGIALHDCDIVTYDRELLARLCFPIGNPTLGFEFAKGYYARFSDRMHGRVTRLYVTPLLKAMQTTFGNLPLVQFLDSFRYPLAGEVAMSVDLARVNRIPWDWGLEVGTLAEVYRNLAPRRVCQVDLTERYDHRHQELSSDDPEAGLMKMAVDIGKTLFRSLAAEGARFSSADFQTLAVAYSRRAEDAIHQHEGDAAINHLIFDRHAEGRAVETFARAIRIAAEQFLADPLGMPLIPSWNRVLSAVPDVLERLREAVEQESEEVRAESAREALSAGRPFRRPGV